MLGEPLSEDARQVLDSFKKAREAQFAAEEAERRRPRLNFIEAAMKAGFTELQAEFMWENRAREHREWMA